MTSHTRVLGGVDFILNLPYSLAIILLQCVRRDKSRSYQWNKDKQDASGFNGTQRPATNTNFAGQELPDNVKRQLWAALTVLSQTMPGCSTVSFIVFFIAYHVEEFHRRNSQEKFIQCVVVVFNKFSFLCQAVDWAIDLQLHQSLSKLLRFAARYNFVGLYLSACSKLFLYFILTGTPLALW